MFASIESMKVGSNDKITQAARIIWDYMVISRKTLHKTDLIFVLGSRDERVATYAAELYHQT